MFENKINNNSQISKIDANYKITSPKIFEPKKQIINDHIVKSANGMCTVDESGKIIEVNFIFADIFGYKEDELIGQDYFSLVTEESKEAVISNHKKILNGYSVIKAEEKVIKKDGTYFYIQTTNLRFNDDNGNKLRVTTAIDISHRLKNELIQSVLLKISNLASVSTASEELYSNIHGALCQLMPVKNFALCLIDNYTGKLEFPYVLNEFNEDENFYLKDEFNYIQRYKTAIILDSFNIEYLFENKELIYGRRKPTSLLGIPLTLNKKIIGAIILKTYDNTNFTTENKEILLLVSAQIARVIERKRYEQELLLARQKAEEAVKLKSEFLAQISHEIRTPLNSILSFSSLIRNELEGTLSEELNEAFDIVERGGYRLTRTIDLLLNVSKIKNQQYKVELSELNLINDVLSPIVKELSPKAIKKNLKLILVECDNQFKLVCDSYSVNQLFSNLIENSIKYTNEGSITIKPYLNETGNIQVDIIDTGIGISKDYLSRIFEPFSQEEQGYTRSYEGIGLGLSLVKSYAELNNAELKVQSEKFKGSIFSVIFNI